MYLVKCVYNEDGLRTQKTHNGTTTNYYYNGSVLMAMQSGNTVQRFSYDAQGKVVAVDYSTNGGSSYTTYYYLRNAQGDIVKLIDNNKNTVVVYTYDSWGKLISTVIGIFYHGVAVSVNEFDDIALSISQVVVGGIAASAIGGIIDCNHLALCVIAEPLGY